MIRLIWETLKERKWPVFIYCAASVLSLILYVGLYPSLQSQTQLLTDALKTMPENLLKALGTSATANFTLEAMLASKQFSIFWQLLAGILAISIAGNDLAAEVEKGTIEFLLSQPISRMKLYFGRFISGTILLGIFAAVSTILVIPIAIAFNVTYIAESYYKLFWMAWLFSMAIYAFSYFFSALFSSKGKVYGLGAALLVVMYAAFLIATLKESLDSLKYISFFHYFPPDLLTSGTVDKWGVLVFILTVIVFTGLGAIIFKERDIATS